MVPITQPMIEKTYEITKKVYKGQLSRNQGAEIIYRESGMNKNTALMYIGDIICMLDGKCYKRLMAEGHTKYFLAVISDEFRQDGLQKALCAVKQHFMYLKGINKPYKNVENIYNNFIKYINMGNAKVPPTSPI